MEEKSTEVWKPISRNKKYEVSDLGRVRNKKGLILKDRFKTPMKYRTVCLSQKEIQISSLVLETFVGPRPFKAVVRHLNGNSQDDRLINLAWGTQSENILDKIKHGTNNFNDVLVKITDLKTNEVFIGRQRELSRRLNLNQSSIWRVCNFGGTTKGYKCEYIFNNPSSHVSI